MGLPTLKTALDPLDRLPTPVATLLGLALGMGLGTGVGLGVAGLGVAAMVGLVAAGVAWRVRPLAVFPAEPAFVDLIDMVELEGGTFLMGSPENEPGRDDDESPQHEVTVSPFFIGRTVITRGEYGKFSTVDSTPGHGGRRHPVTEVSWHDAVAFCNRLSERAGLEPCYRIDGEDVEWVGDEGYRLPTEAEWEYAARAGTTTRWSFGDDKTQLDKHAWYSGNARHTTHPVARLEPNPWGLYDVHGNVWEWCWDRWGPYSADPQTDPRGPSSSGNRVVRGGSFGFEPRFLRSAIRVRGPGWGRVRFIGFRCVRAPRRQLDPSTP